MSQVANHPAGPVPDLRLWDGEGNESLSNGAHHMRQRFNGAELTEANAIRPVYGNTVFRLTERGTQEILSAARVLPNRMRRCLFLIDGFRAVRELSYWMRANEIDEVFAELERARYILRLVEGDETYTAHAPLSVHRIEKLDGIKKMAVAHLRDRLGGGADFVVGEIENCRSDMDLRVTLRAIEDVLVAAFGKQQALEFVKSVGGETMEM
jgi:hypothetical protein